ISRATTSVGPAAANGTMILTGRSGYPGLCASAAVAKRSPVQAASTRANTLVTLMGAPWLCPALRRASTSLFLATARGRCCRQARPQSGRQPVGNRLTNGGGECKHFLARPNAQAPQRSAPTRPVGGQRCHADPCRLRDRFRGDSYGSSDTNL